MHGSLLPKYRGRAPTNWAVLNGETETGATLHEMIARPDAGAIVDQIAVPILPDDTGQQVFDKVTVAAEQVLWRSLPALIAGQAPRRANEVARGSYFSGRRPEDGRIDWAQPAARIYDLMRAVAPPYPGAFTEIAGRRLVVAAARLIPIATRVSVEPRPPGLHVIAGQIVGVGGDGAWIDIRQLLWGTATIDADALGALLDVHAANSNA
jgi:methionyl-tRNA formyltransferase